MLVRMFYLLLLLIVSGCSSGDSIDDIDRLSPSIAEDGTFFYRVFVDRRNGNDDIYFERSSNGIIWLDEQRLNDNTQGHELSQTAPKIAVDTLTGNLSVVWEDHRNGNADIYFVASTDQGITWSSENYRVNRSEGNLASDQTRPSIDVLTEGNCGAFVAWEEKSGTTSRIFLNRTVNNGISWFPADIEIAPGSQKNQLEPEIMIGQDCSAMIVWQEGDVGDNDIFVSFNAGGVLTDNTMSPWQTPVMINDVATGDQAAPDITFHVDVQGIFTNDFMVAWQDNRNGDYDIYAALVTTGSQGTVAETNVVVSNADAGSDQTRPSIGNNGLNRTTGNANGNTLFAVWSDSRGGGSDIYTNFSNDDNGQVWQSTDIQLGLERQGLKQTSPVVSAKIKSKNKVVLWEEEIRVGLRNLLSGSFIE